MKRILLRQNAYEDVTKSGQDGTEFLFRFTMVNADLVDFPEEAANTKLKIITVSISRTLRCIWLLNDDYLKLVLFETAKRKIIDDIQQRKNSDDDERIVMQQNDICPFDPKRIQHPDDFSEIVEILTK